MFNYRIYTDISLIDYNMNVLLPNNTDISLIGDNMSVIFDLQQLVNNSF